MTYVMQAATCTWMLAVVLEAWPPRYGAPLWVCPPLPTLDHIGASVRVNTLVDMEPIEPPGHLWALNAALARDSAALDAIEADLRDGLAWLEASVVLWLGGDQLTEHALISLTDQGFDSDQYPALIGAALA